MFTAEARNFGLEFIRCLDSVKNGDDILIAESGKIIARITKEKHSDLFVSQSPIPLISKGLVISPTRSLEKNIPPPVEIPGKPVSEMVTEDRR
ncbi:MAG: hypothetical protein B6245_00325 [Desulfobacteraceae bacterium 4572_88]|nr:MAG: hypothetical protein B6245_00325 [Desulfobacteraceae bacterium 4572_88]